MGEESEEKKENPVEQIEAFINWLKADWSHIALVIVIILFVIVLIAYVTRRR